MSTQTIEQAGPFPMARPGVAKRLIAGLACVAAMFYLPAVARAQSPKDGFDPGANGLVSAIAVQSDGKIVVGGNFTTLGGGGTGTSTRNYIGRLNPDGSLETAFNPGANNSVESVVIQADGKILVGGSFTTLGNGGTASRNYLGRLNPDGSLDASFNPGANGGVKALAVQADGKILVGGLFTTLGGGGTGNTARHYIGRLNADGSLDTTFDPGANNHIFAVAAGADGTILVGGTFTTMGGGATGNTARNNLARLTAAGVVDLGFNPGANDQVFGVATQPDGKIVIGGRFTALGGGTGITPASKVGRLNTDGSVDAAFNPGADNDVLAVVVQLDGKVVVGGTFAMLGGGGTGTTIRNAIGRLNPDGSLDTSFNPGAANVHVLATQADGMILVGGLFSGLGGGSGTLTRNNIGRLYPDGSVDADFDPGADNFVEALAVQADGRILVGGNFVRLGGGGTTTRDHLGRLNADGSLDATFNPGADAQINVLALQPDGKILVGGEFSMLGGGTRNALGRLNTDGSLDSGFDPGAAGFVYAMAVQADGKILVGGLFTFLGGGGFGTEVRNNLGRLNPDGSLDLTFDPGANGTVLTVAVQPDGKILVGGLFTTLGGGGTGNTARHYIGRLNADGSLDTTFDPGANGPVHVAALQPDGMVLLGGAFTALGGGTGTTPRNHLGRLNPDGSLDGFNPGADEKVHALAVQADGTILVGGEFSKLGGGGGGTTDRSRIARLNVDGSVDPNFNPVASYVVYALALQADGKILTGGGFTTLGGAVGQTPRNYLARLTNTESASQRLSVTSDGNVVTWSRSGAAPEISRATFELSTDGATFASLGSGTAVPGEWRLSGQSLPLGQNLFVRARGYHTTGLGNGSGSIVESIRNAYIRGAITCSTITLSPASLYTGILGTPYGQTITQSGGGVATTAFIVSSGALPPGVTLWPTGLLTGTPTQTGSFNFTITATDTNGCSGSLAYTLIIALVTSPTITAQPQSQSIASGQPATLIVSTRGTAPLTYQWYQGPSGTTTAPIGGATGSSYTTPALTSATSYWVRVSNPYGTADSTTAAISVTILSGTMPPTISAQPQSQTITAGQAAVLSVGATGSATLVFQWYRGPSGTTTTAIVGATANSYMTPALTSATSYWVRVSNPYGTADSTTAAISVTLLSGTMPPTISAQPQSQTITAGQAAVLSVGATGSATLAFQWYQGPSATTTTPIAGATANSFMTPALASAASFWVRVSNAYGTTDSNTATITVTVPPTITTQPGNQRVNTGQRASFTVAASGTPAPTYQWQVSANAGASWTDLTDTAPYSGTTTSTLTLAAVMPGFSRYQFRAIAANFAGSATSNAATLVVRTVGSDADGDRKADLTVFRPSNGTWYSRYSTQGYSTATAGAFQWGLLGDLPISGDFDGDGKLELTVWRPSDGTWYIRYSSLGYDVGAAQSFQWGMAGDVPIGADFDGDGKTDLVVWRPSDGTWYVRYSSLGFVGDDAFQWGTAGDVPVAADFDDDGKTDLTIWRPANGTWYIRYSSLGYNPDASDVYQWGRRGDLPISADFDGDGKTDLAVWRPSNGTWYVRYSSLGFVGDDAFQWGTAGDVPVAADFDGDGKTDLTIWRPANGTWYIRYSSLGFNPDASDVYQWGMRGDTPLTVTRTVVPRRDYDGDGSADIVVFRPVSGSWYVRYSSRDFSAAAAEVFPWGRPGDVPVSGDFDGDGKLELTVWRPANGTWYIRYSSLGFDVRAAQTFEWGLAGDVPIAADFDGDGKTDIAVWRPSTASWQIRYSSLGFGAGNAGFFQWGQLGDVPIAADFDGDGRADLVVWRPGNGTWYVRFSTQAYAAATAGAVQWGQQGDLPISADFDDDGKTDLVVWRPSNGTWYVRYSTRGFLGFDTFQWGLAGDVPVAADFDGDGKTDLTIWRPANGTWYVRYSSRGFVGFDVFQWGLPGDNPITADF